MGESSPTQASSRSRTARLLQLCLWLILPVLLFLYLLYAVANQEGPAYRLVSGTPVERYCLKVIPYLWRHLSFLERQSMDAALSEKERRKVRVLLARMDGIRPTHSFHLKSGRMVFGRPVAESDTHYDCRRYDGTTWEVEKLAKVDLLEVKPVTFGQEEFSTRNLRFLLATEHMNHYYLHPYLFATPSAFSSALRQHAYLSRLESHVRKSFGPLINEEDIPINHVRNLADPMELAKVAGETGSYSAINSVAFYDKKSNTLYLDLPLETDARQAMHPADIRLIRHEGAHHLAYSLVLFPRELALPFWIEEGFSQYCELEPFEDAHSVKLAFLKSASKDGTLLPWDTVLTTSLDQASTFTPHKMRLLYAQSWLLFHTLMQKSTRPGFLKFLSNLETLNNDWQQRQGVLLGNAVGKSWGKIESALTKTITDAIAADTQACLRWSD